VVRVERVLGKPVRGERRRVELLRQRVALQRPDAVLPRQRAAQGEGRVAHPVEHPLPVVPRVGIGRVDDDRRVQVAVSGMGEGRNGDSLLAADLLDGDGHVGQTRDRHRDVGRDS